MNFTGRLIKSIELGHVPDVITRHGIRRLLLARLKNVDQGNCELNLEQQECLIRQFANGPVAVATERANEQHYEIPPELFQLTLGPRRKYSCCWWPSDVKRLDVAEERALAETCRRAEIIDGMDILELGCGWGSLSLWLAEKYPLAKITAISNSNSQREFILSEAKRLGVAGRLNVITADMNDFNTAQTFDRVVSVEMFEHMRNYQVLMKRISVWLRPAGKLFVHIFCHRNFVYEFQDQGEDDWMSRYFFTGGVMPSDQLLARFQHDVTLSRQWRWNGMHYQRTCEAWLANMDRNREPILEVLSAAYGKQDSLIWFNRWRLFYLACSELFGFNQGNEWWVSHYLFERAHFSSEMVTER